MIRNVDKILSRVEVTPAVDDAEISLLYLL